MDRIQVVTLPVPVRTLRDAYRDRLLFPEKAGGCRKYTGKHRAARTGINFLLLWPAFIHIRRGGILVFSHNQEGK